MTDNRISRFEDLDVWKRARRLSKTVYHLTGAPSFRRDFALRDQMRRAAVSVMSNIAEGFDRYSRAELHRFLVYAKSSCAELRSQSYIAHDVGYLSAPAFLNLRDEAHGLCRMLGAMRAQVDKKATH